MERCSSEISPATNGTFAIKRDAFQFARPPEGTFTHAAIADYDRDGRLDIYFCLYSYYLGLDQYHYPVPYFDARNGPANFLLHNEGNATFIDRTEAAGLNTENNRYSFACAWGESDASGSPDLYVANDFGRSNLYRNNGDGTFTAISGGAHVENAGAGMSACWSDFDNGGKQDIYAANMWSAAGSGYRRRRYEHPLSQQRRWNLYRRFRKGGDSQTRPRYSITAVPYDFNNDGWPDIYVAVDSQPSILFQNNHDGTFTDVAVLANCAYSAQSAPASLQRRATARALPSRLCP